MAVQLIHGLYSQTANGSTINTTGEQSLVGTTAEWNVLNGGDDIYSANFVLYQTYKTPV